MSTTVGNGLTVDGTVKASQATQAGEAVVLGEDGLVPASLVASNGGGNVAILPHFITISWKGITISGLNSTALSSSTTQKSSTSARTDEIFLFRYGVTSTRTLGLSGTATSCKHGCSIKLSNYASQLNRMIDELIPSIRTNLRGNFKITGNLWKYGEISTFIFSVAISDDGIEVIEYPSWPTSSVTLRNPSSFTSYEIRMYFSGIDNIDEGWY